MSLEEGRDYKVIYLCKVGKDEGCPCGFNTYTLEDLEKHFLASHPTSQQIANIFRVLAENGLNVETALEVIRNSKDLIGLLKNYQTVQKGLEEDRAKLQRDLNCDDLIRNRLVREEREACIKIVQLVATCFTGVSHRMDLAASIIKHIEERGKASE